MADPVIVTKKQIKMNVFTSGETPPESMRQIPLFLRHVSLTLRLHSGEWYFSNEIMVKSKTPRACLPAPDGALKRVI